MSTQFDASLGHIEPIADAISAAHRNEVETTMKMPGALANAKLHAQNELNRLISACNRVAFGGMPSDLRAPNADEMAQFLAQMNEEDRGKLMRDAQLAAEQRALVAQFEEAEIVLLERQQAEQGEQTRLEGERIEFAEFEAYDDAGKQQRFDAWRALRLNR